MNTLKIVDTISQYDELLEIQDLEKRKDYFRYEMMKPFKQMWSLINVPLKAKQQNGYDVVMAQKCLVLLTFPMIKTLEKAYTF